MKKQHQLLSVLLIGIVSLSCWYFFVKKYTYEFEILTPLDEAILVEILKTTYPATHPDLDLVKNFDDEVFVYQFTDGSVSILQEIKIQDVASTGRKLSIGVNAKTNFFKERLDGLHKETIVQVFNRFLLLQLDKEIASKKSAFQ